MDDSEKIEALSMDGSPIEVGSVVRYLNTGTVGIVTDLTKDEEGVWVLLDSTGLFYKPEVLVITDESELKGEMKERTSAEAAESYMRSYNAENEAGYDIGQVTGGG
ncbi:hypothetical protein MettiDRAFT_1876 [Methanolobus tindarius DSM 2278]|uniref:DUF2098 domain-containing protein n=1 Tax=Methanolobus tindarius DSM 2278 TaxID=1090322 RepID=W9DXH6_METTI|nr:DUF2098 domain-containing protein [Methanolobus tindarius]ETA68407.1 hypothetical protein MettiDRAFT_1876 [Methanolobus tindarius DSM 2278]